MHAELYYSEHDVIDVPENRGFEPVQVRALLRRLQQERGIACKILDASRCSRAQLDRAYEAAVTSSVCNRYRIRRVFGTNRSSGSFFGRGVPALLVYEGERPIHVFPHREQDGAPVTIRDYLEALLAGDARGQALASRMDQLRGAIGPIGISTAELVREGRRR